LSSEASLDSFASFESFALFSDVDFDDLELDSDILESLELFDDELDEELELDFSVVFELLLDFESALPVFEDEDSSSSHSSSLPFPFPFPLPQPLPLLFFLPFLHLSSPSPLPSPPLLDSEVDFSDVEFSDVDFADVDFADVDELLVELAELDELDEFDEPDEPDNMLSVSLVDQLSVDSWVTVVVTVSICETSTLSVPLISLHDSSYVTPFTANPQYFIANPLGPITTMFTMSLGHPTLDINGER
jgi:hypothetical protein